ncbi:hypothetical protein FRC01_012481 [Tulasnella sp. 417]|nr:hypothetical protein FRC01_012481 [Tulasnella sp. 417]
MATQKNSDDITDINERADDGALDDNVDDGPDDNVDDGPDDLADDGPDDSADDPDDLADDGPDDLADDGQDELADDGPDDSADDPDNLADDGPDDLADDGPDDTADGPDDTADDPDDGPDDGFNNSVDDSFNDDGNDGANGIVSSSIISSSTQSPTPSALVNAAGASAAPAGGLVNAAEASPASTGQSKTSVKIIGGIVAALLGILIIFSIAIFYLKRRWRAKEQKESHRGIIFDAKAQRDEEEGGGEGASFIGEKKGHSREDSMASTRSKSSTDDYLKTGRKRSSLGTYQTPGVAPEEAYMMFGGSTADLNDEDEKKPLTYHQRHLSENSTPSNRHSWSGAPAPTDPRARRISLLDDDSRYPAINGSTDSLGVRPQMRHSVSHPSGVADPFSDSTPTGSPRAPSKALTTGDIHGSPPPRPLGARPPPPPGSPSGGRRISLKGGVGVRQARSQSIGASPVTTPKSAWK